MLNQIALVSQTNQVTMGSLALASAALQKQVGRDFGPMWNIQASVDTFERLDQVPLGYWSVVIGMIGTRGTPSGAAAATMAEAKPCHVVSPLDAAWKMPHESRFPACD